MNLYQSIFRRKSVRKYFDQELSEEVLDQIKTIIESPESLYDIDIDIKLIKNGPQIYQAMKGIIGNIGKILAPHYLLVTSENKDGYLVNSGYILEEVILKLTEMGIATCWIGGHQKVEEINKIIDISDNHEYMFMISFGYPEDGVHLYRKKLNEIKRKSITDLVINSNKIHLDSTLKKIFSAIRVAPSAANSQPWRFKVDENKIHVFMEKRGFIKKHFFGTINLVDIGIALKHLEIAAEHHGRTIRFKKSSEIKEGALNYITSVEIIQ